MAKKNQWLINQCRQLEQQKKALKQATNTNVSQIYACFAKVLMDDYKHTPDYIEKLFIKTQDLWGQLVDEDKIEDMVDWCEKTTGISLRMEE